MRALSLRWVAGVAVLAVGLTAPTAVSASPAASSPAASSAEPVSAPEQRIEATSASLNWAGYVAASSGAVQSVSAKWRVPDPGRAPGAAGTHASVWVGIGGSHGTPLLQAGSEQDADCTLALVVCLSQHVRTYLWYEIYPDVVELPVTSIAVSVNDVVTSTVSYGSGVATFTVCNATTNHCATIHRRPSAAPSAQAEWIVERPTENGQLAMFADVGTVLLAHARYVAGGRTYAGYVGSAVDMYSCFGNQLARTAPYNRGADTFTVSWLGYGSVGC